MITLKEHLFKKHIDKTYNVVDDPILGFMIAIWEEYKSKAHSCVSKTAFKESMEDGRKNYIATIDKEDYDILKFAESIYPKFENKNRSYSCTAISGIFIAISKKNGKLYSDESVMLFDKDTKTQIILTEQTYNNIIDKIC